MVTEPCFESYRRDAIIAARELLYGPVVVAKLKKAKTEGEVCRIMRDARNKKIDLTEMFGKEVADDGSC